ncbi:beta-lactamase family protein [Moniliophthora roreri]|nr:beta-lactamase family protein [Moniliophthora roreri]
MSSSSLATDVSVLVALAVEWGFLPFFGLTIRELSQATPGRKVNKLLILLALTFFMICTATVIVDVVHAIIGFITLRGTISASAFFAQPGPPTMVTRGFLYMAITVLADAVVAYRCFVVWNSRVIAAIPWMMWLGLVSACIGVWYDLFRIRHNPESVWVLGDWIKAFYGSSLATNLISTGQRSTVSVSESGNIDIRQLTGLLAFRIWSINRYHDSDGQRLRNSTLMNFMRVVVDSGTIYSVFLIITLIVFTCGSNLQFVLTNAMSPIICIAFYLIIIRVEQANRRSVVESVFNTKDAVLRQLPEIVETKMDGESNDGTTSTAAQATRRGPDSVV